MSIRPLFVLSLPRSGSTLVQRVLAGSPEVATAGEPWVLLPQLYALRDRGAVAEYGHGPAARAIGEFVGTLPAGKDDYLAEVRRFALGVYGRAAQSKPGATLFLDKTPRYHMVAEDLFRVFPDAAFVLLWRNPLAVAASIIETWAGGAWTFGRWRVDLYEGVANLVGASRRHADALCAVRYEDLVGPARQDAWRNLFGHVGLAFDPGVLAEVPGEAPQGRMGDPTGARAYTGVSDVPLEKWKATFANPYRKRWARRYLEWIGEERLRTMGYALTKLRAELDGAPSGTRRLGSDLWRGAYGRREDRRRERAFRRLSGPGRW
jgi:hypothetical protein